MPKLRRGVHPGSA